MTKGTLVYSFINALAVAGYALVSLHALARAMQANGPTTFFGGELTSFLAVALGLVLLLIILFAKPFLLFHAGLRHEAWVFFGMTALWLFGFIAVVAIPMAILIFFFSGVGRA